MSDFIEIKVDTAELEKCEKKLSTLSKNIANRRLDIHFADAKGSVADNLIAVAGQLNAIGSALAILIDHTETAVINTRAEFSATDLSVAQWFEASED